MTLQSKANRAGWSIFDEIFYQGVMSGQEPYNTQKSLEWYYDFVKKHVNTANAFKNVKDRLQPTIKVGHMYIYKYYAKYADDLPYWDACPLVFPFREDGEHFWALNLHYAPPKMRIIIMKELYKFLSDTRMDEKTKLRLTYAKLERLSRFALFKPLVHCYRKDHVRSLFIKVDVRYWPVAVFLPIAKWQKKPGSVVYRDYNTGIRTKNSKIIKVKKAKK